MYEKRSHGKDQPIGPSPRTRHCITDDDDHADVRQRKRERRERGKKNKWGHPVIYIGFFSPHQLQNCSEPPSRDGGNVPQMRFSRNKMLQIVALGLLHLGSLFLNININKSGQKSNWVLQDGIC